MGVDMGLGQRRHRLKPLATNQTGTRRKTEHLVDLKLSGRSERCGAGDGNRTRVISLEGWGSTIELLPPRAHVAPYTDDTATV